MTDAHQPIRDAATVILVRKDGPAPAVLMGQRGEAAAFMPSKYVFPGGALDAGDASVPLAGGLRAECQARLDLPPGGAGQSAALAAAAIRELWEETGLRLGRPGTWPGTPPADWKGFAATGLVPDASTLRSLSLPRHHAARPPAPLRCALLPRRCRRSNRRPR